MPPTSLQRWLRSSRVSGTAARRPAPCAAMPPGWVAQLMACLLQLLRLAASQAWHYCGGTRVQ